MITKYKQEIEKIIKTGLLSKNDLIALMVYIRKLSEVENSICSKYPALMLFCNWVVHSKIDKNFTGIKIIKELNELVIECKHDHKNIYNRVHEVVFGGLKEELIILKLVKNTKNDWLNFLLFLIDVISEAPLKIPEPKNTPNLSKRKKIEKLTTEIKNNPLKDGMWVTGVSVKKVSSNFVLLVPEMTIHFILGTSTSNPIEIPVRFRF